MPIHSLAVAAESSQAISEWLTALSFGRTDRLMARGRHAGVARHKQLEDATATAQRRNKAAAARVQQLNEHYEQADRGAQVKWFFQQQQQPQQPEQHHQARASCWLRCRAGEVGDGALADKPLAYTSAPTYAVVPFDGV